MRVWTEEEKKKQALAIRRWNPWKKSTGPRTAEGKARSSQNARTSEGLKNRSLRTLGEALKAQRLCVRLHRMARTENNCEKRTIMGALFFQQDQRFRDLALRGMKGLVESYYGVGWWGRRFEAAG